MERRKMRKRATRSASASTREAIQRMWRIFFAVLFLAIITLAVIIIPRVARPLPETPPVASSPRTAELDAAEWRARAKITARGFLQASTVEDMAPFVKDRTRVEPLMHEYYQRHPIPRREFQDLTVTQRHTAGGREFLLATLRFQNDKPAVWVFERDEDNEIKLHWEHAVLYSEKDWETFLKQKDTESSIFRVTLEPLFEFQQDEEDGAGLPQFSWSNIEHSQESYFGDGFDDRDWACFRVEVPGFEGRAFGYLSRENDDLKTFVPVSQLSKLKALPAIVTLRFPEDAQGTIPQIIIEEIHNFSWITGVDM